jgi:hypothetical protein
MSLTIFDICFGLDAEITNCHRVEQGLRLEADICRGIRSLVIFSRIAKVLYDDECRLLGYKNRIRTSQETH